MNKANESSTGTLRSRLKDISIEDDLFLDPERITDQLLRQPGQYAYYAGLLARAKERVEQDKLTLDLAISAAQQDIRKNWEVLFPTEKMTEKLVDAKVSMEDAVVKAQTQRISSKRKEEDLRAIVEALRHRKEMIITYSADRRAEQDMDFSMKDGK